MTITSADRYEAQRALNDALNAGRESAAVPTRVLEALLSALDGRDAETTRLRGVEKRAEQVAAAGSAAEAVRRTAAFILG